MLLDSIDEIDEERSKGNNNNNNNIPINNRTIFCFFLVSVHPLCQDIPLKILSELDDGSDNRSRHRNSNYGTRLTPCVTVVTDLGGAHKTWFNPGKFSSWLVCIFFLIL